MFLALCTPCILRFTDNWKLRREAISSDKMAQHTWDNYPKYPNSNTTAVKEFCGKVSAQYTLYKGKKGIFGRAWVMEGAAKMPAYLWWDAHGASVPELQQVARLVLSQPASSSICERINSEFAFIKDRKRNRLVHERANKLVGLFHNLRLMLRMKKPSYVEPAVGWDRDGEGGEGVGGSGIVKFGAEA